MSLNTRQRPWWLALILIMAFKGGGWGAGILGVLGIIFGFILLADYGSLGSGLAMLWAAAITAFFGGFVLVFQALRVRAATH